MIGSRLRLFRLAGAPWQLLAAVAGVLAVVVGRAIAAGRPADEATPLVIAVHLYALLLVAGMLLLAAAFGRWLLRRVGVVAETRLEHGVFAVALGLGLLAYGTLLLGLAQLLTTPILLAGAVGLVVLLRHDLLALVRGLPAALHTLVVTRHRLRLNDRALGLLIPVTEVLFLALLVHALVPPTANDALTYHLLGPRRFLELGGLAPMPDVQQANMPLAINLLFLLGLAFGSDEMAAVLHLALALLLAAATYSLGRRFFGERVGWLAATAFVSTQMMLVFASVPYIDYGFALFDFLAVYAFVVWWQTRTRGWLLASGLLVGCALGAKYLGAITALSLGVWLLVLLPGIWRRTGWRGALGLLLTYGLPAAFLAAPWYLKNLVWFGNPVWPFLTANPNDFNMYLGGTTRFPDSGGVLGAVLLPLRLFVDGSVEYPAVRPPLALLLLPLYLVVRPHRVTTALLVLAGVQFIFWTQGAHLLRYMLTSLPPLCLVAAYAIVEVRASVRFASFVRPVTAAVLLLGLLFPTIIAVAVVLAEGRAAQLVGLESRHDYLARSLDNHRLVGYLNGDEESVSRVMTIGDNRTFYLAREAWVDVSLEVFQRLAAAPDAPAARAALAEYGVSHVLVNAKDLAWYAPFDPDRRLSRWWREFEAGRDGYLVPVATNAYSTLYRVANERVTTVDTP